MGIKFKNNAYGVLSASFTPTDVTITLTSNEGDRFPVASTAGNTWFFATLVDTSNNREIVKCINRASGSDSLVVYRGQDGTTAQSWDGGTRLEMRPNAGAMDAVNLTNAIDVDSAATNTLTIDANENAAFTNEISTGSTKN